MKNKSLKYTCLFGGGAIRGAAYVGAIKALEELGISPVNIAGSSVGSVVAALLAIGYNAEELKQVFLEVNFDLFRDFQLSFGPRLALSKGEVFLEWMRDLVEKEHYGEKYNKGKNRAVTFKDIKNNLVIITTNISNFECKEFSRYETPDFEIATAVRISCSMPGLMKPVEYNNTLLVDGDLQKSLPMWKLSNNLLIDDERVLEFRLEGDFEGSNRNVLDYMNTIYSCFTAMGTSFIKETFGHKDKFDYVVINTGDIVIVDFNCNKEKREELINSGYVQTIDYFTKSLPYKKGNLLNKYYLINKYFHKIQKQLGNKQIIKAKSTLSELFIELCDMKDFIDTQIFDEIKDFQIIFFKNIKYPALFGKISLQNLDNVKTNLNAIMETVSDKIYETENYLNKFPI